MIKHTLLWILIVALVMGIFNTYSWYCSELMHMSNLQENILNICFLNKIIFTMLSIGLIFLLTPKKIKINILILIVLILTKILILSFNFGFESSIDILKGHIGHLFGLILGFFFFKKIKVRKNGLIILLVICLILNTVYPMINLN